MAGVSQKIELQGEKEYRQAIKNAERELKTLEARLKAETAELGKNATEQEKNAAKIKSLQKQIAEQEKIVKTYTDALQEVQEKYSDNADEIAKWEQKLLKARETLANMRNSMASASEGLRDVQTGMEGVGAASDSAVVAARSVAETIGDLANIGDGISDGIEGIFFGMVSSVKEAITEVWGEMTDLAARSNALLDMAGFWNTDIVTLQKYKGAVANINGDLSDLNDIVTKINAKDSKKITELLGISKEGYQDDWQYAMAVMDALASLRETNFQAGNNAAFEIFGGRQATKAMDLLNDWRKLQENLARYDVDQGGYGLNTDQLQQMSDLADKVSGLRHDWQTLRDMMLVQLTAKLGLDITSNAQGLLDSFLEYLNADGDEGKQAAIDKMRKNIESIFQAIREAIEEGIRMMKQLSVDLKKSEDPLVKALGNVLGGVADVMEWFTVDNAKNAATALGIVAGAWALSNVAVMVGNITKLAAAARTIKLFGGLGSLLGAGGNGAVTPTATPTVTPTAVPAAGAPAGNTAAGAAGGSLVGRVLGSTAAKVVGGIAAGAAVLTEGIWTPDNMSNDVVTDEHGVVRDETTGEALDAGRDSTVAILPDRPKYTVTDEQRTALEAAFDAWKSWYRDPTDQHEDAMDRAVEASEKAFEGQEELFDTLDTMMNELAQKDDWINMKDLPAEWFTDPWRTQGKYEVPADWWKTGANADGITSQDLQNFDSLPNRIRESVENGMAKVVGSITLDIDGYRVARILAPMVSQEIARDMV